MRRALLPLLFLATACSEPATTVTLSVGGAPIKGEELVVLPYDRDSVVADLTAKAASPQPDAAPLVALLDSLRQAYASLAAAPMNGKVAAQRAFDRRKGVLDAKISALREAQHEWRESAYRTYDSVTFRLIRDLARDPFTDTTDATGTATIRPKRGGPWWVTVTAWDPDDPFSEWYWNARLTGDTLRLTTENARRRPRI